MATVLIRGLRIFFFFLITIHMWHLHCKCDMYITACPTSIINFNNFSIFRSKFSFPFTSVPQHFKIPFNSIPHLWLYNFLFIFWPPPLCFDVSLATMLHLLLVGIGGRFCISIYVYWSKRIFLLLRLFEMHVFLTVLVSYIWLVLM